MGWGPGVSFLPVSGGQAPLNRAPRAVMSEDHWEPTESAAAPEPRSQQRRTSRVPTEGAWPLARCCRLSRDTEGRSQALGLGMPHGRCGWPPDRGVCREIKHGNWLWEFDLLSCERECESAPGRKTAQRESPFPQSCSGGTPWGLDGPQPVRPGR